MRLPHAFLMLVVLGICLAAAAQSAPRNAPVPPGSEPPSPNIYGPPAGRRLPHQPIDPEALQRDARQLLELSQSVQPDIEALRRGLLSKDLTDKLKRIEKLSKRLRSEVAPLGN